MTVVQIGSYAILLKWIILAISILLSLGLLKVLLHTYQLNKKKEIFDLFTGTLFFGFLCWKGSLFLLDPQLVIKSPLSLLFFTGGTKGLVIAVMLSIIFIIYKSKSIGIDDSITIGLILGFGFTTFGSFHVFLSLLVDENALLNFFVGIVALVCIGWILLMLRGNKLKLKHVFTITILYCFYYLILSIFIVGSFSIEQWFFIGVIVVSLYMWDRKLN
ncbi:hypothetical protein [Litchfieldia salsa]|uniref:Uncharacterized protein n=1 Tax=Litchfieldia salsa TaxID=930152 RepID=A0A1H0WTP2_9BACI|nr:hypothetical protein [Litchfieldia salsa]SDP94002.1 hypothetical protein SAMN05216565_11579 [Litchfieldia salsa]